MYNLYIDLAITIIFIYNSHRNPFSRYAPSLNARLNAKMCHGESGLVKWHGSPLTHAAPVTLSLSLSAYLFPSILPLPLRQLPLTIHFESRIEINSAWFCCFNFIFAINLQLIPLFIRNEYKTNIITIKNHFRLHFACKIPALPVLRHVTSRMK